MEKIGVVMTIDPGGETGICLVRDGIISFRSCKNDNWEKSLDFIANLTSEEKPQTIVYETTNYVHKRIPGTLTLLKLIGGIVGMKYAFNFVKELNSIAVNQVKFFKNKLFLGQEKIEGLTCEVGRGKGWKYKGEKINLHQLDALIIYNLWSKGSLENKEELQKKVHKLKIKERLGVRQKEKLKKLQNFLDYGNVNKK